MMVRNHGRSAASPACRTRRFQASMAPARVAGRAMAHGGGAHLVRADLLAASLQLGLGRLQAEPITNRRVRPLFAASPRPPSPALCSARRHARTPVIISTSSSCCACERHTHAHALSAAPARPHCGWQRAPAVSRAQPPPPAAAPRCNAARCAGQPARGGRAGRCGRVPRGGAGAARGGARVGAMPCVRAGAHHFFFAWGTGTLGRPDCAQSAIRGYTI
jgi:hypothetical protein